MYPETGFLGWALRNQFLLVRKKPLPVKKTVTGKNRFLLVGEEQIKSDVSRTKVLLMSCLVVFVYFSCLVLCTLSCFVLSCFGSACLYLSALSQVPPSSPLRPPSPPPTAGSAAPEVSAKGRHERR
jgi:hypothetical protein